MKFKDLKPLVQYRVLTSPNDTLTPGDIVTIRSNDYLCLIGKGIYSRGVSFTKDEVDALVSGVEFRFDAEYYISELITAKRTVKKLEKILEDNNEI
jgi:hypothetical protein